MVHLVTILGKMGTGMQCSEPSYDNSHTINTKQRLYVTMPAAIQLEIEEKEVRIPFCLKFFVWFSQNN
jgi:hypothetical protein